MKKSRKKMVALFMVMIMLLIGCSSTAYCKEVPSTLKKPAPYIINMEDISSSGTTGTFLITAANYGSIGSGEGYYSYENALEHPVEINSVGYEIIANISYHHYFDTIHMVAGDAKMLSAGDSAYLYVVVNNPSNVNSQSENKSKTEKPYIIKHNNSYAFNDGQFIITSEKYGFIGSGKAYHHEYSAAPNIVEVKSNSKITVELFDGSYSSNKFILNTGDSKMLSCGSACLYVIVSPWTPESETEAKTTLTSNNKSELEISNSKSNSNNESELDISTEAEISNSKSNSEGKLEIEKPHIITKPNCGYEDSKLTCGVFAKVTESYDCIGSGKYVHSSSSAASDDPLVIFSAGYRIKIDFCKNDFFESIELTSGDSTLINLMDYNYPTAGYLYVIVK